MWDWAEGESDNDLTKNYPFPVPRIRDLPNEFRSNCCDLHSYSLPPDKERSQETTVDTEGTLSNNLVPIPYCTCTVIGADDSSYTISDEDTEDEQKSLGDYPHDSNLQPLRHVKPARHSNIHSIAHSYNPRRSHRTLRYRSLRRHRSYAKSIVEEPPDASQQDVAKARLKFFHKTQNLRL